jgi:hypothetical protein
MNFRFSKTASIYSLIYLLLFIASLIYAILFIRESPLAALYVVILTFPWSFLTAILLLVLDIYDVISTNMRFMMDTFYAIMNTIIIYYLFYKREDQKST